MSEGKKETLGELEELFLSLIEEGFCGEIELHLEQGELLGLVIREKITAKEDKTEDLVWNRTTGGDDGKQ